VNTARPWGWVPQRGDPKDATLERLGLRTAIEKHG